MNETARGPRHSRAGRFGHRPDHHLLVRGGDARRVVIRHPRNGRVVAYATHVAFEVGLRRINEVDREPSSGVEYELAQHAKEFELART
jgi:hypothetical protein